MIDGMYLISWHFPWDVKGIQYRKETKKIASTRDILFCRLASPLLQYLHLDKVS